MGQYSWENCAKTIKAQVNTLQTEFQRLLEQNLIGLYLHGSLALGGFNPGRSDIDIIAITEQSLHEKDRRALLELLLRVSRTPAPLDIYFLVEQKSTQFQQPFPFDLHFTEQLRETYLLELRRVDAGLHHISNAQSNSLQYTADLTIPLAVVRRRGIYIYGQSIEETIPVVPEDLFRAAYLDQFRALQEKRLQDPISFVLNACRIYAYFVDGTIYSKDMGGQWALSHLPEEYAPLINQSLALYRGERLGRHVGRAMLDHFSTYIEGVLPHTIV
jgi:Domain of unknown function (DUF4111)/Nucleotidyltransferase domain